MPEQKIAELERENAQLRAELATAQSLLAQLSERVLKLQAQLAKKSHNSDKPPSSDGYVRSPKKRSLRKASGKKPGGQTGHTGHTLKPSEQPDQIISYYPEACEDCHQSLSLITANPNPYTRRQVFELPEPKLEVIEYRAYQITCPHCQHPNSGSFPEGVNQPVQYGAGLKALAAYLVSYQLLPYQRTCELLNSLYGTSLSQGSLTNLLGTAFVNLEPAENSIKAGLGRSEVLHCDETGFHLAGKLLWLHVASTKSLTYYHPHPKRGKEGSDAGGILPHYSGTAVHDGLKSYFQYSCQHALCNAHHLRELTFVAEQLGQDWAAQLIHLLLKLKAEVASCKASGATALPPRRLLGYETIYSHLLEAGLTLNPPNPKTRGNKTKQSKVTNLLLRLTAHQARVLAFAHNFAVPFDNNQAERDIRMLKVQQKISGGFRSLKGVYYFCRLRSYLSTMHKQGHNLFALLKLVFQGLAPLPV